MDEHIGVSSSCAPQAVCFRHPADVRLATAGRKPGGAKSNVPIATQGALCQFQALACQPALRRKYSEASRPMIKQIARLENQRATGMVFPIACPHEDLLFSSFGAKLRALAVFPNYITVLARAEDEEPKLVETGTGDDKVIMLQYEKVLALEKRFRMEAFCQLAQAIHFNRSDGEVHLVIGKVTAEDDDTGMVLVAEKVFKLSR